MTVASDKLLAHSAVTTLAADTGLSTVCFSIFGDSGARTGTDCGTFEV